MGQLCYCGAQMIAQQECHYQCPNCGAVWDCEDVTGLPK